VVALRHGRRYIGIDISEDYLKMSVESLRRPTRRPRAPKPDGELRLGLEVGDMKPKEDRPSCMDRPSPESIEEIRALDLTEVPDA